MRTHGPDCLVPKARRYAPAVIALGGGTGLVQLLITRNTFHGIDRRAWRQAAGVGDYGYGVAAAV